MRWGPDENGDLAADYADWENPGRTLDLISQGATGIFPVRVIRVIRG
jgi:hypothetical protein